MAVKRGLGRGLNDLLSVSEDEAKQAKKDAKAVSKKAPAPKENQKPAPAPKKVEDESSEVMVKVTDIEPNPNQPRTNFNEDALNELAESIKRIGVIEPIVVYKKERERERASPLGRGYAPAAERAPGPEDPPALQGHPGEGAADPGHEPEGEALPAG